MAKVLHPNQYPAMMDHLLYDLPLARFEGYQPDPLALHVESYIEKTSLKGSIRKTSKFFKNTQEFSYDDLDFKRFTQYHKQYKRGYHYAERFCTKNLGLTVHEALEQMIENVNKKLKRNHFFIQGIKYYLNHIQDVVDFYYFSTPELIVEDGIIVFRNKLNTMSASFRCNSLKYERIEAKDTKNSNYELAERFQDFVKILERNGAECDIEEDCLNFKGFGVQGHVSIYDCYTYGLVFVSPTGMYNKPKDCELIFAIPESYLGRLSAMKDIEYLGTKQACKEIRNNTYQQQHTSYVDWWSL